MAINSLMELFTLLLYANDNEPIRGDTKITKITFLILKNNVFNQLELDDDFEPYNFGPYSYSLINDIPLALKELDIISIEYIENEYEIDYDLLNKKNVDNKKIAVYSLTEKGIKVAQKILQKASNEEFNEITRIKEEWNNKSNNKLIEYVYNKYVKYTTKSKIRNKYLPDVEPELLELIGTVSEILLDEEKELLRKKLIERYL